MRALVPLVLVGLLAVPAAIAQDTGPTEVQVGLLVINFGNYDVNKGTYTLDFYLFFTWDPAKAPEGFTPEKFEFMNGRASAKDKIFDEVDATTGERELWYRIQANLNSEPLFEDFPFDTQTLHIEIEDSIYPRDQVVYVPNAEASGLHRTFKAAGWRIGQSTLAESTESYAFGEDYSRIDLSIPLSREKFSTTIKTMLPPAAFVLVAALQYFIHPTKWSNRLGLGTGMLITSVMFHISQTVSLPPMAKLILFDKVMIAVYLFIVASLAVTTLIAIDEDYWKDRDYTRQINLYGGILSILVPGLTLAVMLSL